VTNLDPYQQWQPERTDHLPVPAMYSHPAPPPMQPMYVAPATMLVPQKSAGAAVALELVLGLFGIFGVGNLYAGRTAAGVTLMLSFWGLFWINFFLIFAVIGLVTMPLTWISYLVTGPLLAAQGVEGHNARAIAGSHAAIGPAR
jgi:TM2 domain-containing membrane protein YozV